MVMEKNGLTLQIEVSNSRTAQLIQNSLTYLRECLKKEELFLKDFTLTFNQEHNFQERREEREKSFSFSKKRAFKLEPLLKKEANLKTNSGYYYIDYLV